MLLIGSVVFSYRCPSATAIILHTEFFANDVPHTNSLSTADIIDF